MISGSEAFLEDLMIKKLENNLEKINKLLDLQQELETLLSRTKKRFGRNSAQTKLKHQPLEIKTAGGLVIQIGRNHLQNDFISLRQAKPGDLWFHAQECPGSHVVLKSSAGLPQDEDIQLAADLAAYFSKAKGNQKVAVIAVPTKQLRGIPEAGPGTISHRGGEVFWAKPDRGKNYLSTN